MKFFLISAFVFFLVGGKKHNEKVVLRGKDKLHVHFGEAKSLDAIKSDVDKVVAILNKLQSPSSPKTFTIDNVVVTAGSTSTVWGKKKLSSKSIIGKHIKITILKKFNHYRVP